MRRGHLSLPKGQGLDYNSGDGGIGVSVNELTTSADRDFPTGTPWHKHVPTQLECL